jgi:hypothetical protein
MIHGRSRVRVVAVKRNPTHGYWNADYDAYYGTEFCYATFMDRTTCSVQHEQRQPTPVNFFYQFRFTWVALQMLKFGELRHNSRSMHL